MMYSGTGPPPADDVGCLVRDRDAAVVGTATEDYLNGGFCVLLRWRRLPCVAIEPIGRSGQTLCGEERRTELLMFRTREFDMMGEFVDQPGTQVRSGPGNSNDDGRRTGVVFGAVVELPRGAEDDRGDAIVPRLVGREEVLPGFGGEVGQIAGNRDVEPKRGRAIPADGQQRNTGGHRRCKHGESECTTHPEELTDGRWPLSASESSQHDNSPRSLSEAAGDEELK